jgi:hypothetical protein
MRQYDASRIARLVMSPISGVLEPQLLMQVAGIAAGQAPLSLSAQVHVLSPRSGSVCLRLAYGGSCSSTIMTRRSGPMGTRFHSRKRLEVWRNCDQALGPRWEAWDGGCTWQLKSPGEHRHSRLHPRRHAEPAHGGPAGVGRGVAGGGGVQTSGWPR